MNGRDNEDDLLPRFALQRLPSRDRQCALILQRCAQTAWLEETPACAIIAGVIFYGKTGGGGRLFC